MPHNEKTKNKNCLFGVKGDGFAVNTLYFNNLLICTHRFQISQMGLLKNAFFSKLKLKLTTNLIESFL